MSDTIKDNAHVNLQELADRRAEVYLSEQFKKLIDEAEQEQPNHINEMPIPGSRFQAEMVVRFEMALGGADQANQQKQGADQYMQTVKACCHEECGTIDPGGKGKGRVGVFIGLYTGENRAQQDRDSQTLNRAFGITFTHRVMGPCYRGG